MVDAQAENVLERRKLPMQRASKGEAMKLTAGERNRIVNSSVEWFFRSWDMKHAEGETLRIFDSRKIDRGGWSKAAFIQHMQRILKQNCSEKKRRKS